MSTATPASAATPVQSIRAKIAAAQPDLAASAATGDNASFLTKALSLFLDILPEIVDAFAPAGVAAVVDAVDGVVKNEIGG